ncbi:MAG TPA: hypothetical protein VMZ06_04420 [Candidatus Bathyarchaeia archaeon]|nr:hypothetical protein [Candidatus Bathyarchaeia archaeon]
MRVRASYYQQFDADYALEVPGEGYGGWRQSEIEIAPERTALVVMHAWDCGTREQFPGWYRCVEYIQRSQRICETVFPSLLSSVRAKNFNLIHVAGGGDYYKKHPGYQRAACLAPETASPERIPPDPAHDRLVQFRAEHVFVGRHNEEDVRRGFAVLDFPAEARPLDTEPVVATSDQLFAICRHLGVNHLVYAGFAINGCLLTSPGGMFDMSRRGILCSTIRQAVTAIENKETARNELAKELALWYVGLLYGFVFDVGDFLKALETWKP